MLAINDLVMSKEMNKGAMSAVVGGNHKVGNYDITRNGAWRRTFHRSFVVIRQIGFLKYRAIQTQTTYQRYQTRYVGRLRLTGVAIGTV